MKSCLNKNEVQKCTRLYHEAGQLLKMDQPKSALAQLRTALKLLERDQMPTRLLALCYIKMAQCQKELDRQPEAEKYYLLAGRVAEQIQDTSGLKEQIAIEKAELGN